MNELEQALQNEQANQTTAQATELEKALEQGEMTKLEQLKQNLIALNKDPKATECDKLSATILVLQQKDYEEFLNGIKNKSYFLSTFFKNELVIRSAQNGCKKASFNLTTQATKAIMGLGFIVEDNAIDFTIRPLDRNTWKISCVIHSENMSNAQIYFYNAEFNLNIPLNEAKEIIPEEEQYENNFTQQKILKII